jgi:hypothetical protein
MWTVRRALLIGLAALLSMACAAVPEGDTRPSAASESMGGPRLSEPGVGGAPTQSWGIDIFSGRRSVRD